MEVIDDRQTGETILDETLKMMKAQSPGMSINSWIDLLSGEATPTTTGNLTGHVLISDAQGRRGTL